MDKQLTFHFSNEIDPLMIFHLPGINCPKCKRECREICENCMATICNDCCLVFSYIFSEGYIVGHKENCDIKK